MAECAAAPAEAMAAASARGGAPTPVGMPAARKTALGSEHGVSAPSGERNGGPGHRENSDDGIEQRLHRSHTLGEGLHGLQLGRAVDAEQPARLGESQDLLA